MSPEQHPALLMFAPTDPVRSDPCPPLRLRGAEWSEISLHDAISSTQVDGKETEATLPLPFVVLFLLSCFPSLHHAPPE